MKKLFLITIVALFLFGETVHSASKPFTEGSLVVYRMGDGTSTYDLSKTLATPVFLDEYAFDEDGLLYLVQSIPLPTETDEGGTGNKRCVAAPSTVNMGYMSRSYDGRYIAVGGFDAALGAGCWGSQAESVNRVVALVNSDAVINSTTALTDAFSTKDLRSVYTTDGINIWMAGNSISGGDGYLRYTTKGSRNSIRINGLTGRILRGFNNRLYVSGQERVYSVGTGFPTIADNIEDITQAPNGGDLAKNPNGYDFCFADLDTENPGTKQVLYFSNANGSIQKYSLVAGTWTYHGDFTNINGPRGMECRAVADGVELYVVCEASGNASGNGKLYKLKDIGGYNNAFVQDGNPLKLLDWSDNSFKAMRSVAWAPVRESILAVDEMPDMDDFSVLTEGNSIVVESLKDNFVEVYNMLGMRLASGAVAPGVSLQFAGLQHNQIYLVKVGNLTRKIKL